MITVDSCRRSIAFSISLCFLATAPLAMYAQAPAGEAPKVLVIHRENIKPGKAAEHEQTEAGFKTAIADAKGSIHYIGMTSLSGPPRALFFHPYASFAAWQDEVKSIGPELGAALDKANTADGDLLAESGASVWTRADDLSTNTMNAGEGARFLEITQFVVKPGHTKEFRDLAKLVMDAHKKGATGAHWTAYELAYGSLPGNAFVVISSLKSMAEVDEEYASEKKFLDAMGEDGMKKMGELESSSIQTAMTNLFVLDPKLSYPPEEMIKAEPGFWKP